MTMKRNKFSLSHYKLMSLKMGGLYPCGIVEVLPGDTFQHSTSMLIRCSPLVTPVMHPVHARVHHWFVPHRIVWDNWEPFITGGPDGSDASVFPTVVDNDGFDVGSLADYFGMATGAGPASVSALPFRAYNLIFNEWYRDQDLVTALAISKADGTDSTTSLAMQNVAWEKDYFTSARPWTQKGPSVTIPLSGNAPVTGFGPLAGGAPTAGSQTYVSPEGNKTVSHYYAPGVGGWLIDAGTGTGTDAPTNVVADLTNVNATDVNTLRLAMALQRYEEARARYGSRYTEYLRYLGVRSSDARLQRPEYLGGGKQTIQFSEVLQTGVTTSGTPSGVGNFGGHGIGALRSNRYRRFFEEHGYVISLVSIKPRTVYAQSTPRTFNRRTKEDFWQRELQHIGQQEVLNKEVYTSGNVTVDNDVFGFQDRYDEYRRQESGIAGQFRESILDNWHMARIFAATPVLNSSFVQANPTDRIFADQTGDDTMYAMISHSIQARRLIAKTGTSFIY